MKRWIALLLALAMVIPLTACEKEENRDDKHDHTEIVDDTPVDDTEIQEDEIVQEDEEVPILNVTIPEMVTLCSDAAKEMYDGELTVEEAVEQGEAYRPCTFTYDLEGKNGTLRLREQDKVKTERVIELPGTEHTVTIDNLKTGTVYTYEVVCEEESCTGSFETKISNRFVLISGAVNTRDIGGYTTLDGKTVRQGMIIRGTELDGMTNPSYLLTEKGAEKAQEEFDFAYEFDLRAASVYTGEYRSCLGENVGHKFYGAPQYGEAFNRTYLPALREIFTDLANPDNYPMYMHCTYGNDRTGTVVFLLQGLLNVSEEDMLKEFRLSGFTTPAYANSEQMAVLIASLEYYDGNTMQEQIVSFLTQTVGVTEEQIEMICNIMLEN